MVGYFMPLLPNTKIMFSLQTAHQALRTHTHCLRGNVPVIYRLFHQMLPHTRHMNMQRCLIYALNTHSGGQWEWCRGVIEEKTSDTCAVTSLDFEQWCRGVIEEKTSDTCAVTSLDFEQWCRGVIEENTSDTCAVTSLDFEQKTDEARGPVRLQMENMAFFVSEWKKLLAGQSLFRK